MEQDVFVKKLTVSYQNERGHEWLEYLPHPITPDDPVPAPVPAPLRSWDQIRADIKELECAVDRLVERALHRQTRGTCDVQEISARLGLQLLPPAGLGQLMEPEFHPQFDIIHNRTSQIPWEALEEWSYHCPQCNARSVPPREERLHLLRSLDEAPPRYCPKDGARMTFCKDKLGLTYRLSHLVRGANAAQAKGNRFLFIIDPCGDLCSERHDPDGVCDGHVDRIASLLEGRGYELLLLRERAATRESIMNALADRELMGVYFFGHGRCPADGGEPSLVLADDGAVYCSEIEEVGPRAGFVFLNACWGAAGTAQTDMNWRLRGAAQAFVAGSQKKTAIAPLWRIPNYQAAVAATTFFEQACGKNVALGDALHQVREPSLKRYEAGEPDISWMAYRYFGDPNALLPAPTASASRLEPVSPRACRVFDATGHLDKTLFAFAIDDVLLRAVKRRNVQKRSLVSSTDLLAGLVRKGDLTRHVFSLLEFIPDDVYARMGKTIETGTADTPPPDSPPSDPADQDADDGDATQDPMERLRELLVHWRVNSRRQFTERAACILEAADRLAQERSPRDATQAIAERDLLETLATEENWPDDPGLSLPSAKSVQHELTRVMESRSVDANGVVDLSALDHAARRIIELAHVTAQQCGRNPIPNRIVLAAFLSDMDGHAARAFRTVGMDPEPMYTLLIAMSQAGDRRPDSFGLSAEACSRVVLPMITHAQRISGDRPATDAELFTAFCSAASPDFKRFIGRLGLDLETLQTVDPATLPPPAERNEQPLSDAEAFRDRLTEDAWRQVESAIQLARERGSSHVRTPHLFVGMLGDGTTQAGAVVLAHHANLDVLKQEILRVIPPSSPARLTGLSPNTYAALERAFALASEHGRARATPDDLLAAVLSDREGIVAKTLRAFCMEDWFKGW